MAKENSGMTSLPVKDIEFILWKNKFKILAMVLAGGILGILLVVIKQVQLNNHPVYTVSAAIAVVSENQDGTFSYDSNNPNYEDVYLAEDMADSVIYVATSNTVLNKVISQENLLGITTDDLKNALTLQQYEESQIIKIEFTWDDPDEGVQILTAMTEILPDILIEKLKIGSAEIVDEPEPVVEENSGQILWIMLTTAIGAIIGILYCFLGLLFKPTFLTAQNVEDILELSVMGEIPKDMNVAKAKRASLVTEQSSISSSAFKECFAVAAHIIQNNLRQKEHKVFYVTSTLTGEGKTTVAANLALQLSKLGNNVLLVDLDVRKPSLGKLFLTSFDITKSVNAIYFDDVKAHDACISLNEHLDFIPCLLEKERVYLDDTLVNAIGDIVPDYDYVILDSSPIGAVADVMNLNQITDQAVFVVKQDKAWQEIVIDSINKLEKSGMKIMGCIFNDIDVKTPGNKYYHKYYEGKYYYVKHEKKTKFDKTLKIEKEAKEEAAVTKESKQKKTGKKKKEGKQKGDNK